MTDTRTSQAPRPARPAPIVNARGVPGTLGPLVRTEDGSRCFLTSHHVLFGRGAGIGEAVWMAEERERAGRPAMTEIGRAVRGQIGRVTHQGAAVFVDCAVAVLHDAERLPPRLARVLAAAAASRGSAPATLGARVIKTGSATGRTEGILADLSYPDAPYVEGRAYEAPGQLLIRPWRGPLLSKPSGRPSPAAGPPSAPLGPGLGDDSNIPDSDLSFSAAGDSGAAVLDEEQQIVGLLWGTNANGEGIACPIAPVLACLRLELAAEPPRRSPFIRFRARSRRLSR